MTLSEKPLLKALKKISKLNNKRKKQQRKCKHKNKDYFSTNAATTIYCKKCNLTFFLVIKQHNETSLLGIRYYSEIRGKTFEL